LFLFFSLGAMGGAVNSIIAMFCALRELLCCVCVKEEKKGPGTFSFFIARIYMELQPTSAYLRAIVWCPRITPDYERVITELNSWPACSPVNACNMPLRTRRLGAVAGRYCLPRKALSFSTQCRFIAAIMVSPMAQTLAFE